jgi:UDP-glucose 4-epimerase
MSSATKKRVAITGGAGFIGSHIVDRFIDQGAEVHIIDNLSTGKRENLHPRAHFHEVDIRTVALRKTLADIAPQIVVHAAAQISVRTSMTDPVFDAEINVAGLVNVLHSFALDKLPFIVFLSTGGAIYGEQEQFPAAESHPLRPTSCYGLSKHVGEEYLEFWAREHGLRHAALRLANVYGPRQDPHGEAGVVAIFIKKLIAGLSPTITGNGTQTRDFVFVGDVARAVEMVCDRVICGTFNIGTGVETSVLSLYQEIANAVEVTLDAHHGPARVGEQLRSVIDARLAQKTFGWQPEVTLKAGLSTTTTWFSNHSP